MRNSWTKIPDSSSTWVQLNFQWIQNWCSTGSLSFLRNKARIFRKSELPFNNSTSLFQQKCSHFSHGSKCTACVNESSAFHFSIASIASSRWRRSFGVVILLLWVSFRSARIAFWSQDFPLWSRDHVDHGFPAVVSGLDLFERARHVVEAKRLLDKRDNLQPNMVTKY